MSDDLGLAHSRLAGLRPEAHLLLALARLHLSPAEQDAVARYLRAQGQDLDWGYFLDQACRHGVFPLIGRNISRYRLAHGEDGRALAPYRWIYPFGYEGNRRRNSALYHEYGKVIRGLAEASVEHVIRKGPILVNRVYRDPGLRRMGDLDILLAPEVAAGLHEVVTALGYQQGHLSGNAERVVPFDRQTTLVWKINLPNSTLPYLKPAHDDAVEVFVLDPCFNLFQPRSGITVEAGEFLGRAVAAEAFGEATRMLDPVDQVIDSCVQLHVEATTLMYIELGKDLTVLKFLDLVELLRLLSDDQLDVLVRRVQEYGCADSAYYALHHAALVYPDQVRPELIAELQPADPDLLDSYGVLDGSPQRWSTSFADRLFDPKRGRSLPVRSKVPGPRAVV